VYDGIYRHGLDIVIEWRAPPRGGCGRAGHISPPLSAKCITFLTVYRAVHGQSCPRLSMAGSSVWGFSPCPGDGAINRKPRARGTPGLGFCSDQAIGAVGAVGAICCGFMFA
jgi:hypothetical protein